MCDSLENELYEGSRLANKLVDHLERMRGAAACRLKVPDRATPYEVVVAPEGGLEQVCPPQWKPIESAPRTGRIVAGYFRADGSWQDDIVEWSDSSQLMMSMKFLGPSNATHWLIAIPPAPKPITEIDR